MPMGTEKFDTHHEREYARFLKKEAHKLGYDENMDKAFEK
mgnify:CR=1 FL=1